MKIILTILTILSVPLALFEYFVLFWFWGGDGRFAFFTTPICFLFYMGAIIFLIKRNKEIMWLCTVLKFAAVLVTPILTMVTVWLLAAILGISITIQ